MTQNDLDILTPMDDLDFATQLARDTGQLLKEYFNPHGTHTQLKPDQSVLTEADLAAEWLAQGQPAVDEWGPSMSSTEARKQIEDKPGATLEAWKKAVERAAGLHRKGKALPIPISKRGQFRDWRLVELGPGGPGGGHRVQRRRDGA